MAQNLDRMRYFVELLMVNHEVWEHCPKVCPQYFGWLFWEEPAFAHFQTREGQILFCKIAKFIKGKNAQHIVHMTPGGIKEYDLGGIVDTKECLPEILTDDEKDKMKRRAFMELLEWVEVKEGIQY
jgi:hypothetical protein